MSKYLWLLLLAGCMNDKYEAVPQCVLPDTVSFSNHILPLFNAHCNTAGCHSGNHPEANFNLSPESAYMQLMEPGGGYVDTINPEFSVLYSAVVSVSNPMPPTGKLEKCSTDLILKWISQNAPNN
jgi:hypothetical protein